MSARLLTRSGSKVAGKTGAVDHQIEFSLVGKPGECLVAAHTPSELGDGLLYLFRGEKLLATDSLAGRGTYIRMISVGVEQLPDNMRLSTRAFDRNSLGGGVSFPKCHPRLLFSIEVEFVAACEWSAAVYGKAIVVPNEGVYAIVPDKPCDASVEVLEQKVRERYSGSFWEGSRCDRCWCRLSRHLNWPRSEPL